MKGRMRTYSIALPIFIVLTLVLGAIAQFAGEAYRNSFYEAGYVQGAEDWYPQGYQAGSEYGLNVGLGVGFRNGYVIGVRAWEDPYHIAALELEQKYPWLDVTLLSGNEYTLAIGILFPYSMPSDYDPKALNADIVATLESVYDGQPAVRIFGMHYNPMFEMVLMHIAYEFDATSLFEYRLEEGTEGFSLIAFVSEAPNFLFEWVGNPYLEIESSDTSNVDGEGGEANPK